MRWFAAMLVALVCAGMTDPVAAEEAKKIQDNSFLLEEAYNQEDGVVQHIQSYQYNKKTRDWLYTFTQEWPVSKQAHQLSYTIPVAHLQEGDTTGLGDIAINYRYQLIMNGPLAVAPRFSLILPTGDEKKGLGAGATAYQVNLPVSIEICQQWVTHWNAGATFTPDAKEPGGSTVDTWGYNLGASVIWLVEETFNVMTEVVWNSTESVQPGGSKLRETSFFINPGVRFARNYKSGLQVVPGFSFPIGIGTSHGEYGALLYLSFEHPLF
jgi:hypothetical protein